MYQSNNFTAFNCVLTYMKMFKYLQFSTRLSQLTHTLTEASEDLAGFLFMFLLVFMAYAFSFHMAFGMDVASFRDFTNSYFTLFLIILGEFDFEELRLSNDLLGPLLFISYIVIVFLILFNMFLAIIGDAYVRVKERTSAYEDPFMRNLRAGLNARKQRRLRRLEATIDRADDDGVITAKEIRDIEMDLREILGDAEVRAEARGAGRAARARGGARGAEARARRAADARGPAPAPPRRSRAAARAQAEDILAKVADDDTTYFSQEEAKKLMERIVESREKLEREAKRTAESDGNRMLPEEIEAKDPAFALRISAAKAAREKVEQIEQTQRQLFDSVQSSQRVRRRGTCAPAHPASPRRPALSAPAPRSPRPRSARRAQAVMLKINSLTDTMDIIANKVGAHSTVTGRR